MPAKDIILSAVWIHSAEGLLTVCIDGSLQFAGQQLSVNVGSLLPDGPNTVHHAAFDDAGTLYVLFKLAEEFQLVCAEFNAATVLSKSFTLRLLHIVNLELPEPGVDVRFLATTYNTALLQCGGFCTTVHRMCGRSSTEGAHTQWHKLVRTMDKAMADNGAMMSAVSCAAVPHPTFLCCALDTTSASSVVHCFLIGSQDVLSSIASLDVSILRPEQCLIRTMQSNSLHEDSHRRAKLPTAVRGVCAASGRLGDTLEELQAAQRVHSGLSAWGFSVVGLETSISENPIDFSIPPSWVGKYADESPQQQTHTTGQAAGNKEMCLYVLSSSDAAMMASATDTGTILRCFPRHCTLCEPGRAVLASRLGCVMEEATGRAYVARICIHVGAICAAVDEDRGVFQYSSPIAIELDAADLALGILHAADDDQPARLDIGGTSLAFRRVETQHL